MHKMELGHKFCVTQNHKNSKEKKNKIVDLGIDKVIKMREREIERSEFQLAKLRYIADSLYGPKMYLTAIMLVNTSI